MNYMYITIFIAQFTSSYISVDIGLVLQYITLLKDIYIHVRKHLDRLEVYICMFIVSFDINCNSGECESINCSADLFTSKYHIRPNKCTYKNMKRDALKKLRCVEEVALNSLTYQKYISYFD